jgi:hypothetical protein
MLTAMLTALFLAAVALTSTGCAPRRYSYDYDHGRRWDRSQYDSRDHDHSGRLDLNRASVRDLDRLPGLSDKDIHRIVANRPYDAKQELVDRRIIRPRQYDRIEDYVYAGRVRDRHDRYYDRQADDHYRPYSRDEDRYQERRFYDDR